MDRMKRELSWWRLRTQSHLQVARHFSQSVVLFSGRNFARPMGTVRLWGLPRIFFPRPLCPPCTLAECCPKSQGAQHEKFTISTSTRVGCCPRRHSAVPFPTTCPVCV